MDPRGNIYSGLEVPGEDKARLEGYLMARAEADADDHAEHLAELEAKYLEAKRQMEDEQP